LSKPHTYPEGVTVSLAELLRYEYYVQQQPILPQHPVYSLLAGRHASRLRGRGLDFEEVRVYVPGDDVRNIDWRVTARTGVTHSKVFNEEKERPAFLIVDQTAMMFFGSQSRMKSVTAAQIAALAAFYILRRGDRVGGIVFNEETHLYIPPERSKSHVQYLLQSIADMNALLPARTGVQPNTAHLNAVLQRARLLITHDFVVTVISDLTAMNDETKQHLRNISFHNDVILVHLWDPLEAQLPDGRLVLGDGRYQLLWQNSKGGMGEKYRDDYAGNISRLKEEFRNYRIPLSTFSTALPVEQQVMQYMGNNAT
jgi:uncharacterized protein (DUF58 family)